MLGQAESFQALKELRKRLNRGEIDRQTFENEQRRLLADLSLGDRKSIPPLGGEQIAEAAKAARPTPAPVILPPLPPPPPTPATQMAEEGERREPPAPSTVSNSGGLTLPPSPPRVETRDVPAALRSADRVGPTDSGARERAQPAVAAADTSARTAPAPFLSRDEATPPEDEGRPLSETKPRRSMALVIGVSAVVAVVVFVAALSLGKKGLQQGRPSPASMAASTSSGLGTLVVRMNPPARATLNGFDEPDGGQRLASELRFSNVAARTHLLKVWRDGAEPETRSVSVRPDAVTEVEVDLR